MAREYQKGDIVVVLDTDRAAYHVGVVSFCFAGGDRYRVRFYDWAWGRYQRKANVLPAINILGRLNPLEPVAKHAQELLAYSNMRKASLREIDAKMRIRARKHLA